MNTEIMNNEPEKQADDKKPVNKSEKVTEKLKALREKLGKSVEAQTAAEKKTKDIRTEIAKCEKYLHDEEVRTLDAVCNKNHITFAEATEFIGHKKVGLPARKSYKITYRIFLLLLLE